MRKNDANLPKSNFAVLTNKVVRYGRWFKQTENALKIKTPQMPWYTIGLPAGFLV